MPRIARASELLVTFFWPGITALILLWLIAFWAILTGIFEIAAAVRLRQVITGEWLLIVGGFLSLFFGLLLLAIPSADALAVVWIIGVSALNFGVLLIALAFGVRGIAVTIASLRTSAV